MKVFIQDWPQSLGFKLKPNNLGIILALNDVKVDFNRSKKVTILMPIIFLTLLAPIGLILPADAGEKMGLQITVMLTVVIYIDVISNSIPGAF